MTAMSRVKKDIGFLSRIALCHITGRRYPLSVTYIATYRCNFACRYCDVFTYKAREMTTSEALSMIDEFASIGARRFSFNGGEPLLRADIGELVARCKARGLFTTMFTNGSLVAGNLRKIKDLDILSVSLDGPEDVHDAQRMKGSFARVVEGIKAAKGAGVKVWTNTVLTSLNLGRVDEVVALAESLGVKMIFQPVIDYSHSSGSKSINGLKALDGDYARAIERLRDLKRQGAPIVHSDEYLDYIKVPVWSQNKRKCWAAQLYCAVTPSGQVAPCYPIFNAGDWPSGLEIGFRNAFLKNRTFSCDGCYCALVETDFLYSFNFRAMLNLARSVEARS